MAKPEERHGVAQAIDAHEHNGGFGETGEFTLARRKGDDIVFLLTDRHEGVVPRGSITSDSALAEPMRRALSGLSGTITGLDHRGKTVLAAHEPAADDPLKRMANAQPGSVRAEVEDETSD